MSVASPDRFTPIPDLPGAWQRIGRGDIEAFAELYDALAPGVARMAQLVLDGGADVSEAVRATFLEIWTRAPDPALTEGRSIEVWALSRAHHHAVALRTMGV